MGKWLGRGVERLEFKVERGEITDESLKFRDWKDVEWVFSFHSQPSAFNLLNFFEDKFP